MKAKAIVSVFDKTGVEEFASFLVEQGIELLSTGGTARLLESKDVPFTKVEDYINHPEVFDGRVKTLHPKIHGGILARRSNPKDQKELQENEIAPIDFVVVNLYPFFQKVAEVTEAKNPNHDSLIEDIDIGGPTMIRAAAKNWQDVVVISDPADYSVVMDEIKQSGSVSEKSRRRLAAKVFTTMAAYDSAIARYLSLDESLLEEDGSAKQFAYIEGMVWRKELGLRYGENPHQQAAFYVPTREQSACGFSQLQGKEISYNNLLDMNAAIELAAELATTVADTPLAVVIKHTNPCGVAFGKTQLEAFESARACDPVSSFGGIIAIPGEMDEAVAKAILEQFVEIVIADDFSDAALEVFKSKKNVRVIKTDLKRWNEAAGSNIQLRSCLHGVLAQTADSNVRQLSSDLVVSSAKPGESMLKDLSLAWTVCKHVKSNTIVIVKDGRAIGIGAGQMSRVDAARIAISRATEQGNSLEGSVAASDAFLPFPDTLEVLNDAGIVGLVQPGGSIKDDVVVESANNRGVVMLCTGERHFRH